MIQEGVHVVGFEVPPSPDSSYTNPIPGNEDEGREPPLVPPHLQHTLLSFPPNQDESSPLPQPQTVVLNHLYIEKENTRSVVALGITHRFRAKFVTVVLYKPVLRRARHRRHGGLGFRTALFGRTHVFVSSPGAARSLLAAEPAGFSKRYVRTVADLLGDHSLLSASHAAHRSLRRAVAPLFSNARSTSSFASAFDSLTRRLMLDWSAATSSSSSGGGGAVVVLDAALGITFEAICGMLVATLSSDARRRMQGDVLAVTRARGSTRGYGRGRGSWRCSGERSPLGGELRWSGEDNDMDFLQSLLVRSQQQQQSDNDEAPLTDEQILDNILTLIIAVGSAGAGAQGSGFPAYDSTSQQHGACIQGFHISKGWIVNIDARSMHYDPKIYDNPTTFDTSRFNGEDTKQPYSYLVFGAGGRTCLGMNLAKIMMLIFLHRLVTTFRWEMADDDTSLEKWAMFPRLKNGCPIHLTPI
ncbi:hypothetical protein HU200_020725 [Digitaria exilis]|uniref:Association with the SNF1 complex (ASC) domain-containing protein n=1 Tax=Digitaria exilis TaxID=1010633 RepID=A0A835F0R2_9POAL|nr:hypothetical protein HU200_020725 [Digitaria exilis]